MNVLVIGATGFIGRHVVRVLIERGHNVTAVGRDEKSAMKLDWYKKIPFISCDIFDSEIDPLDSFGPADAVIYLAWPGLPNYQELFHFEKNLPKSYDFLKRLVFTGYSHILVLGTCFEYGMQNGCLSESDNSQPVIPYGIAKDNLCKYLQALQRNHPFILQWARLFYMYGDGQNQNSLLVQLDHALDRGDEFFNMSAGEQLRDYLPVTEVAKKLVILLENPWFTGIMNICSGKPISIRTLVENHLKLRGKEITLNLGYYPYSPYEPMAFWGDTSRYNSLNDNL